MRASNEQYVKAVKLKHFWWTHIVKSVMFLLTRDVNNTKLTDASCQKGDICRRAAVMLMCSFGWLPLANVIQLSCVVNQLVVMPTRNTENAKQSIAIN